MPELDLHADLRLSVVTPAGRRTSGRLTGAGRELQLELQDPQALVGAVDAADVGRLADALSAAGVTMRVSGPSGQVGVLGAGAASRLGKIVTGSRSVAPSLAGSARGMLPAPPGTVAIGAALAAVVVAFAAVRRRLRRR